MKILKSRTNITIIVMFLIGGIEAVSYSLPEELTALVLGVLGAMAIYFRTNPRVKY